MLSFYSKREDSNVERDAWCWLDVQLDLKLQGVIIQSTHINAKKQLDIVYELWKKLVKIVSNFKKYWILMNFMGKHSNDLVKYILLLIYIVNNKKINKKFPVFNTIILTF